MTKPVVIPYPLDMTTTSIGVVQSRGIKQWGSLCGVLVAIGAGLLFYQSKKQASLEAAHNEFYKVQTVFETELKATSKGFPETTKAIENFSKSSHATSGLVSRAYIMLGQKFAESEQWKEALTYAQKSETTADSSEEKSFALSVVGASYEGLGDLNNALDAYVRMKKNAKGALSDLASYHLVTVYYQLNRPQEAQTEFEILKKRNETSPYVTALKRDYNL